MSRLVYISYALLSVALLAWAAVIYESYAIEGAATARAQAAATAQQMSDQAAYSTRMHSLATETALQRAQLDALTNSDVVTIVSTLESTGKSVSAKVTTALPEGSATALPGGGQLQGVSFVVNASGSFSAIMRALALYEQLVLPSKVEQVDIEKLSATDGKSAPWHMTLHIQVITSAAVST